MRIVVLQGEATMELYPPVSSDPVPVWMRPHLPVGVTASYRGNQRWLLPEGYLLEAVRASLDEFGSVEVVRRRTNPRKSVQSNGQLLIDV